MKKVSLDANKFIDRIEAHEYLKEMLGLPEYYGKNLDALYDCLTELDETEVTIELLDSESSCLKKYVRVFMDAAQENEKLKVNII